MRQPPLFSCSHGSGFAVPLTLFEITEPLQKQSGCSWIGGIEMSDDRGRIVEGFIHGIPASETRHQFISLKIASALLLHVEPRNLGHVLQAPCNVFLARGFVIQPDICFVEKGRSALIGKKYLQGSPDLIIEIMSEDTREDDLKTKRKIYSCFEVKEYWTVDLKLETVEVLLWSELGYATVGLFGKSDRICSPALPRLELPLRRVFTNQGLHPK